MPLVGPAGFGGEQAEDRPEPLAATEQAVAHRLGQPGRAVAGTDLGGVPSERLVHPATGIAEDVGEGDRFVGKGRRHGAKETGGSDRVERTIPRATILRGQWGELASGRRRSRLLWTS